MTRSAFQLTGKDFQEVDAARFGTLSLEKWTGDHDAWWATGAFRVVSDTEVWVYPPIGLVPGNSKVRFSNVVGDSNEFSVAVQATRTRTLLANADLPVGKPLTVSMARGPEPSSTLAMVTASPVKQPSVLKGLVSLEIGAGFSALAIYPSQPFNAAGVLQNSVPTDSSLKGHSAYIEGVYLRAPLPLPTTNAWQVKFK